MAWCPQGLVQRPEARSWYQKFLFCRRKELVSESWTPVYTGITQLLVFSDLEVQPVLIQLREEQDMDRS